MCRMKWKKQVATLSAYKPGMTSTQVKEKYGLDKIIKLASNENPFGSSASVQQELSNSLNAFALYPDGAASELRQKVADLHNVSPSQLLFGNGSDEIILIISRALLEPGKNTIMATPTFPQYKHNATLEGAESIEVPLLEDGHHNLTGMLEAINENTSIIWVCSPNNPTGTYIPQQDIEAFLDKVPQDIMVVIDQAYYEYITEEETSYNGNWFKKYPNACITRTFSKAYGLASFRVGYVMGSESIIQQLEPVREPFNNNSLGQIAAAIAVEDQTFIHSCRVENAKGIQVYEEFCEKHGLHMFDSQGNFVLIDVMQDSDVVFEKLLQKGIIVRSGNALGFPGTLRITVGTKEQNEEVMQALKDILALD